MLVYVVIVNNKVDCVIADEAAAKAYEKQRPANGNHVIVEARELEE